MHFDVLVIGSGPGGYVAAIRATHFGKKVGIVERSELGGICLNWGCIPTKALLRSAEIFEHMKHADSYGLSAENVSFDFPKVIKRSRDVAGRMAKGVAFLMKKNKIEVIAGTAKLTKPGTVEVALNDGGSQTVTADKIIIATGARARQVPGLEADGKRVLTYREAMVVKEMPGSVVVVGAGAIGVEFAYFFNSLGAEVTIVEMLDNILPVEDEEVSKELAKSFKKKGIKIHTGTKVENMKKGKNNVTLTVSKDGKSEDITSDYVLMAIGVQPNNENLGLEDLGITMDRGWIKVNEYYQTNVDGIYAIGDIIGPPWLAHVSSKEAILAVEHMMGEKVVPLDYSNIPGCTYCQPQVASVGLTEKKAKEAGYELKIGRFPIRVNGKAQGLGETEGFIKIIYDAKYGELLGCHIIGPEATELITEVTFAKSIESTYMEVLHTVHPHPTLSEIVAEATHDAIGEPIHT
ncbi:MAG TPA: dihydrolipoyl dehydrogenase [Calditrichia bacterium]|nr:dihydrolipoyl dehydrogenase [Calditrichota bacterium]HQU74149.1 dihydrolipoyl dehydrogenase [Calditrichia bacterium]HQV32507.1 dihydrolipoyl dehydrogenase [Calditrichia bacterium]